jgi:hypothetical protein
MEFLNEQPKKHLYRFVHPLYRYLPLVGGLPVDTGCHINNHGSQIVVALKAGSKHRSIRGTYLSTIGTQLSYGLEHIYPYSLNIHLVRGIGAIERYPAPKGDVAGNRTPFQPVLYQGTAPTS